MDFGDAGESYMEHWVNEYWDFDKNRWVLADVDGYYEYEQRFGYSQFDLPRRKFVTASEAAEPASAFHYRVPYLISDFRFT